MHNSLTNIPLWAFLAQQSQFDGKEIATPKYILDRLKPLSKLKPEKPKIVTILKIAEPDSEEGYTYVGAFLEEDKSKDVAFKLYDRISLDNFFKVLPSSYVITNILDLNTIDNDNTYDMFFLSDNQTSKILKTMEAKWPGEVYPSRVTA